MLCEICERPITESTAGDFACLGHPLNDMLIYEQRRLRDLAATSAPVPAPGSTPIALAE